MESLQRIPHDALSVGLQKAGLALLLRRYANVPAQSVAIKAAREEIRLDIGLVGVEPGSSTHHASVALSAVTR